MYAAIVVTTGRNYKWFLWAATMKWAPILFLCFFTTALADDPKPDRATFIKEVVDAKPTAATPKFNDYTPNSYHVDQDDLTKGLIEFAGKEKIILRGIVIIGPMLGDPLWTYYVLVFIKEKDGIRVNSLVFPHARITYKSTGPLSDEDYQKLIDGLIKTEIPKEKKKAEQKGAEGEKKGTTGREDLYMVVWDKEGKKETRYSGDLSGSKSGKEFGEQLNRVLKQLKKTYPESDDR
jgi:hypothetical protein